MVSYMNNIIKVYEFLIECPFNEKEKMFFIKQMVNMHEKNLIEYPNVYKKTYFSFPIIENNSCLKELYSIFLEKSKDLFGEITLTDKNTDRCWINISSRNDNNLKHNHLTTSVINGVYYLSVPELNSGKITFSHDKLELSYQPKENYLVIFPNYLDHLPSCCDSDNFRIAINMEINCKEDVWKVMPL